MAGFPNIPNSSAYAPLNGTARPFYQSGQYTVPHPMRVTTAGMTNERLYAVPFWVPETITIDRIAVSITSAGEAGSVIRLGVYSDDGTGLPGDLLVDAGTVAGDSASDVEVTLSQAVPAGTHWLACVAQSAPSTAPTIRVNDLAIPGVVASSRASALQGLSRSISQNSVSGALPDPWGAAVNTNFLGPIIAVRTA